MPPKTFFTQPNQDQKFKIPNHVYVNKIIYLTQGKNILICLILKSSSVVYCIVHCNSDKANFQHIAHNVSQQQEELDQQYPGIGVHFHIHLQSHSLIQGIDNSVPSTVPQKKVQKSKFFVVIANCVFSYR